MPTTTARTRVSARNKAAVDYLREVKTNLQPRVTNEQIAEQTGIKLDQVKRLLTNKATFSIDEFVAIAVALNLDPVVALRESLGKVVVEEA